jgi:hypothetical protein
MCASCGKSAAMMDACEDYSNEIIIENDTHYAAASPPPQEHDIVVEAFAVPDDDIVIEAAEQGENNNNGEQQQDDKEAVVQHPPQPEPSSSDNVPAAQTVREMISIVGIFECSFTICPVIFLFSCGAYDHNGDRRSHPEFHHCSYPSNICRHHYWTNLRNVNYSKVSTILARTQ